MLWMRPIVEWNVLRRELGIQKLALGVRASCSVMRWHTVGSKHGSCDMCAVVEKNGSRTCLLFCVILCLCDLSFRCSSQTADSSQVQNHEERVSKHLTVHYHLWLHQSLHQKVVLDKTGKIPHAAVMQSHKSEMFFCTLSWLRLWTVVSFHTGSWTTSEPGSLQSVFGACDQEQRIFSCTSS